MIEAEKVRHCMLQYIRDQILELVKKSLGASKRKLAGSSVITYRSWSQLDPQGNSINRITV